MKSLVILLLIFYLKPALASDFLEESYKKAKAMDSKAELGRMLFFDKILSGNKNISCATCHNPMTFTSDALSLSVGEGGKGLGTAREALKVKERVPRNSPAIFNLGGPDFKTLFHDGRVELNEKYPSGVKSPAGMDLPEGLTGTLAVQALFPLTSGTEMAGHKGDNPVANAAAEGKFAGEDGVWNLLVNRIKKIPEYVERFKAAFSNDITSSDDITIVHLANAIAIYESQAYQTLNSPYDQFILGDKGAVSESAKRGHELFKGKAKCITCHSGLLQTDHKFHAIAIPPIGPGKGDGLYGYDDFGRERVTKNIFDRYKFRTPSLRNVAVTGPWGHNGAYGNLKDIVLHHIYPKKMLKSYTIEKSYLPFKKEFSKEDIKPLKDKFLLNFILMASELPRVKVSDSEVDDIVNFLHCLTDLRVYDLHRLVPKRVPSGLPMAD